MPGPRGRAPTRSRRGAPPTSSPRSTSPARHRLRLVVKGGGHSYQGTSNAADSLLVWTRSMYDGDAARRLRAAGLRRPGRAGARRLGRCRRALVAGLRRGHDPRRRLCPGRRLHDGRRRRAGPERRLRQLLQGLRAGLRQPAGSRGGDRRRRGAHRQRLQRPRAVLGPEGRRRRQPRHRHPADLARASPARGLRRGEPDGAGGVAGGLSPARRHDARLLQRPA